MNDNNIMRFRQEISADRAGTQVAYMTTYLDSIERRSDAFFDSIEGRPAIGRTGQLGSPQVPASRDPRAVLRFVGEQVEQEMTTLQIAWLILVETPQIPWCRLQQMLWLLPKAA